MIIKPNKAQVKTHRLLILAAEVKVLVLVLDVNDKPHLKPIPGR